MISDEMAKAMLKNIELTGGTSEDTAVVKPIINGNLNHILNLSSGAARMQTTVPKRFALILTRPSLLKSLHASFIRCAFCRRVISYPCWYYSIQYAVSHFHYFVCFDAASPNSVNCKCYRKG